MSHKLLNPNRQRLFAVENMIFFQYFTDFYQNLFSTFSTTCFLRAGANVCRLMSNVANVSAQTHAEISTSQIHFIEQQFEAKACLPAIYFQIFLIRNDFGYEGG